MKQTELQLSTADRVVLDGYTGRVPVLQTPVTTPQLGIAAHRRVPGLNQQKTQQRITLQDATLAIVPCPSSLELNQRAGGRRHAIRIQLFADLVPP